MFTVVGSLILLGWVIDQVVNEAYPDTLPDDLIAYQKIVTGIAGQLNLASSEQLLSEVASLNTLYQVELALDDLANIALPQSLSSQLQRDQHLMLQSDEATHFYTLLAAHPDVLLTMTVQFQGEQQTMLDVLLTLFLYLGISGALIIWLVPLTSRLSTLNKLAARFGQGELDTRVNLSRFSYIDGLEKSFNRMASQIEELVADNKLLAGSLSHDLRTPVSCLRFGIEAAQSTDNLADKDRYLVRVEQELVRLEDMLEAFLEYASMERQGFALNPKQQDLVSFTQFLVEKLMPLAEKKSIQMQFISHVSSASVVFDGHWLHRACTNILSNALDYCQSKILVEIHELPKSYQIRIHDDGKGVSDDNCHSIFEAFVTSNESRTRDNTNFGLGLAIVKRVAHWHGGTIDVTESLPLSGACFRLTLPKSSPLQ